MSFILQDDKVQPDVRAIAPSHWEEIAEVDPVSVALWMPPWEVFQSNPNGRRPWEDLRQTGKILSAPSKLLRSLPEEKRLGISTQTAAFLPFKLHQFAISYLLVWCIIIIIIIIFIIIICNFLPQPWEGLHLGWPIRF